MMNSETTPFAKQKQSARKNVQKNVKNVQKPAEVLEKTGKRKTRSDDDDAPKGKSSKKKLNFGKEQTQDSYDLGVNYLPGASTSGPSSNLRSKRRLQFSENETRCSKEESKRLRQEYREKIGPNWRYYVRCLSESSDEDEEMRQHPLPPGATGTYIRYHLVNNGSDIVGVREYY